MTSKHVAIVVPLVLLAALFITQYVDARTAAPQALPIGVYLPLVYQQPVRAAAPTPISVPPPDGVCGQNTPPAVEGLQAWMTNPSPVQNSSTMLCVWLIVRGQGAHLASASATVHYKASDRALGPVSTRINGSAALPFSMGRVTIGYTVLVDVAVEFRGQRYTTRTSFTPIASGQNISLP